MSRLRRHLTFANVVSVLALFIALGGGSYAAVKLKNNQVKSKHIAPDAVQGADANESSFGPVPRADQADSANTAATAANATTLDGLTPDDLLGQGGNGFDDAIAGFIDTGTTGGIEVFEGAVGVACSATPQLVYFDLGPDPADTDLWVDGVHADVADEGFAGPFNFSGGQGTKQVHIWGGGGTVAHLVVSAFFDSAPSPDECRLALTSQENLDIGASSASASARARRDLDRGALPGGWVSPRPER
jgi:hypothetical protein